MIAFYSIKYKCVYTYPRRTLITITQGWFHFPPFNSITRSLSILCCLSRNLGLIYWQIFDFLGKGGDTFAGSQKLAFIKEIKTWLHWIHSPLKTRLRFHLKHISNIFRTLFIHSTRRRTQSRLLNYNLLPKLRYHLFPYVCNHGEYFFRVSWFLNSVKGGGTHQFQIKTPMWKHSSEPADRCVATETKLHIDGIRCLQATVATEDGVGKGLGNYWTCSDGARENSWGRPFSFTRIPS